MKQKWPNGYFKCVKMLALYGMPMHASHESHASVQHPWILGQGCTKGPQLLSKLCLRPFPYGINSHPYQLTLKCQNFSGQ